MSKQYRQLSHNHKVTRIRLEETEISDKAKPMLYPVIRTLDAFSLLKKFLITAYAIPPAIKVAPLD